MTVAEAIALVDALKPNHYTVAQKVGWLNELDGMLHDDVIMTHEHDSSIPDEFEPYSTNLYHVIDNQPPEDVSDDLIAPHPYDIIYRYWLESQIDLANAEMVKYNASAALYNAALDNFAAYYNRNHRPIPKVRAIRI